MHKIYRILGKRGRITIPYEIRQRIGFRYNDVLSFTELDDSSVVVRREKICDNCQYLEEDFEENYTLEDFLDSLSDVGRILRTFKIKKNVEVTDNGKDNF